MAEAIPFGVAQTIIENLGSMAFAEIGSVWGVKDEFEKLKDTVSAVQAVLLDAEEQQVKNHQVKHWLMRLRDAVYDADDLLTDFYTEDLRQRVMGGDQMAKRVRTSLTTFFSSSNQLAFRHDMAKKITSMRERFDAIANDMNKFQFLVRTSETRVVTRVRDQTYSFVCEEEVIGREEDKKAIIDLLLDYDVQENVSFMSMVGIGGLGKTTLAQYVYNDEKVKNYFELRMWVCVSDVFDVKTIAEKIIRCAGSKLENPEMEQVQNELRKALNQKKYLLVLDDVWNEDEDRWYNLKRLLMGGSKGSKVVITTRTKLVAEITSTISPYYLKGLLENQSWSLFKQMAFRKRQEMINPNLEEIGMDIVQKCYGVPLVIKAIGRILYFKKTEDEWLYIKNKVLTNVTQEENNTGISPILKLSYDHLPSHLKCCFTYCSLFPKDYEISKLRLINLWIAQGFIQSSNEKLHVEDVANEYCMDLLWRSFFQVGREDSFGNIISFKMHDLIHDLAQSISRVECTYIDSNIENVNENVRHLSTAYHRVLKKDLSSIFKAKKIRTLILRTDPGEEESSCQKSPLEILFSSLKWLRALDLQRSNITTVPNSIEELKYLKYLNLSFNRFEVLPSSITKLLNLQTLNLTGCYNLKELPGNIQNLFNLRNLELEDCRDLTHMPPGIGQLTSLQVLPLFIVNEELTCAGLPELNKLNNLRGKLRITIKVRVKDAASKAKAANLKDKQYLRKLELIWDDGLGNDVAGVCEDENLMEGLQPHQNLKMLNVESYQGVRFPSWLPSLTGLVILEISISLCQHLSPMYQLPNLRNLSLINMDGLEYISDREITEEISASSSFFPSLESLKLRNCPNLMGWWRRDTVGVATSSHQCQPHVSLPSFPRLLQLEISLCENLTCMPLFPNLEEHLRLRVSSCNPLQQTMNMTAISSVPSSSNSSPPLCKLQSLSLCRMEDIEFLPEQWLQNLASLEELRIEGCNRLKSLSLSLFMQHLTSLKTLLISECKEVDLFCDEDTQSVGVSPQITVLENLKISNLPNLISLPEGIGNFTALQKLEIYNLPCLISLPEGIGNFTALQKLEISNLPCLISLPEGIGNLTALQKLQISNLRCPVSLPEGIGNLTALQDLEISNLRCLISLPEGIGNLAALQNLGIYNLRCLISFPEGIGNLTGLQNLGIHNLRCLISFPEGIGNLTALQDLEISNLRCLISLPEGIGNLTALQNLRISKLPCLISLPEGIGSLTSLERFEVRFCPNLTSLPSGMHRLSSLQTLIIIRCPHLKERYQKGIGEIAHVPDFQYRD
ncbi:putative disease resistance protein RGA3 [Quercus suber]|uniref:putative disease resistance protein RGA3 n=1 Tax=Quercus suber TaxID=58331 RepID=UPI000CE19A01|nr:putative disease resistance protein RGA3 [Quercus suber]